MFNNGSAQQNQSGTVPFNFSQRPTISYTAQSPASNQLVTSQDVQNILDGQEGPVIDLSSVEITNPSTGATVVLTSDTSGNLSVNHTIAAGGGVASVHGDIASFLGASIGTTGQFGVDANGSVSTSGNISVTSGSVNVGDIVSTGTVHVGAITLASPNISTTGTIACGSTLSTEGNITASGSVNAGGSMYEDSQLLSARYAPLTGSTSYAPATGSSVYAPLASPTFTGLLTADQMKLTGGITFNKIHGGAANMTDLVGPLSYVHYLITFPTPFVSTVPVVLVSGCSRSTPTSCYSYIFNVYDVQLSFFEIVIYNASPSITPTDYGVYNWIAYN